MSKIMVTTDAVGGVWRYSLTLLQHWTVKGMPVELAVLGPEPDAAQRAEVAALGVTLHVTGLGLDWTAPDAEALEAIAQALAGMARTSGATSVHLHAPALVGARVTWPVPVVATIHSCLLTWWQAMRDGPPPPDFAWRIEATRIGISRARCVIAPSVAFGKAVEAAYGLQPTLAACPNGRTPMPGPALPAAERPASVLSAGRFWDEAKDAATLDAAAALIDAPVRAAGSFRSPQGQTVETRHLQRLGQLDEAALGEAFAQARVFVSTARYEPFGLAVLEAAQAGLALVLSDIPTFRELWAGAARFVTPGDAAGFAAAIQEALQDPTSLSRQVQRRAGIHNGAIMATMTLGTHLPKAPPSRWWGQKD